MDKLSLHFEVHPSVVYQLGESLITDSMVAIIELVKNSFDADASYSKVVIDTLGVTKQDDSYYKNEDGGIITIEDDGCGMNLDDLQNGWFTISNRQKLDIKQRKETTRKGRTPLGDKGLGRLGVQKLGKNLEVYTKKKGERGFHIGFSWSDFTSTERLEYVEIKLSEINFLKQSGTKIVISGLMEPKIWKNGKEKHEKGGRIKRQSSIIERLKNELSCLISPYKEIRDFTVYIEIDGKVIDLIEISDSVRNTSLLRYKINFDGNILLAVGKTKIDYFLPNKKDDIMFFHDIVKKNDGIDFLKFIEKQKYYNIYKVKKSTSKKWFIEFKYEKNFSEIDKVEYGDDDKIANPGSFFGEVDAFNLNIYDEKQHIFDQKSEYRDIIKNMSGIRVFRDGFAIRVDGDWLGLGKQQTIGSSFYGLRPLNTLGFISLTARDNMNLEETTDREGFKDTSYYRNFFLLLSEFIKFSSKIQEDLRRSWNDFRKEHQESISGIDTKDTIADITATIKRVLAEAPNHEKNIHIFKEQILQTESVSTKIAETLINKKEISSELRGQTVDLFNQFKPILDESKKNLDRMGDYLSELNSLKNIPNIIDGRIEDLHRQIEIMYESVALGLTAEALAHEINNITDRLIIRSKAIKIDLSKRNITDGNITEYIEYVYSAVIALQKQMSFLSPTLRYVREKRIEIVIDDFINEIIIYFNERWDNTPISIKINKNVNIPFIVKINKGKLIQIIDNIILNSEYWLKEDMRQEEINKGIIFIYISPPYIDIWDNGRGIDPNVETILFDPFVTTKAKGRGLGLFIVKQFLSSENCDIELLPERNKRKHLYKFRLDLGGIINE